MKYLIKLTLLLPLFSVQSSFAQNSPLNIWGGGLNGSTYQQTAIYSELPLGLLFEAPLDASGNRLPIEFNWRGGGNNTALKILPNKNVGIGTNNPVSKLDVNGGINIPQGENITWGGAYGPDIPTIASTTNTGIVFYPSGSTLGPAVTINRNGNLLVGKTTQANTAYKIDVNGKVRATEIKVEASNWPDYVFEESYKVGTLAELESYIKANKRLPEMPAAKEIETNGLVVGEVLKLQQKKIEELTLHLIEKDKELRKIAAKQKEMEALLKKLTEKK